VCGKYIKTGDSKINIFSDMEKSCRFIKDNSSRYGENEELYNYWENGYGEQVPSGYVHFSNGLLLAANKSWSGSTTNDIGELYRSMFAALSNIDGSNVTINTEQRVYTKDFSSDEISISIGNRQIKIDHNISKGQHGYQVEEYLWTLK
jgi:hypothetical protein